MMNCISLICVYEVDVPDPRYYYTRPTAFGRGYTRAGWVYYMSRKRDVPARGSGWVYYMSRKRDVPARGSDIVDSFPSLERK